MPPTLPCWGWETLSFLEYSLLSFSDMMSVLKRKSNFYFYATFLAYLAGLLMTIFVMHVYKHAQPALLYLVPACLGVPLFLGLVRGDIKTMFSYEDHPDLEADKKSK